MVEGDALTDAPLQRRRIRLPRVSCQVKFVRPRCIAIRLCKLLGELFRLLLRMAKDNGRSAGRKPLQYAGDVLIQTLVEEVSIATDWTAGLNEYVQRHRTKGLIEDVRLARFDK